MKKSLFFMGALLMGAISLSSCGGAAEGDQAQQAADSVVATVAQPTADAAPDGAKIYKEKCQVCHMENGLGVEGAFPPLANSDYLLADKPRAIRQVLKGSSGEITVNGKKFNGVMPPQVETDAEAVAVINYVLSAWGNNGGTVSDDDVKKAHEMQ